MVKKLQGQCGVAIPKFGERPNIFDFKQAIVSGVGHRLSKH